MLLSGFIWLSFRPSFVLLNLLTSDGKGKRKKKNKAKKEEKNEKKKEKKTKREKGKKKKRKKEEGLRNAEGCHISLMV